MSDTNRVDVAVVEEATLGTTPATPAFELLRITGAPDLAFTPQTTVSEELRSDRQVSDLALVGATAGGGLPIELSYGTFDKLIQAAMFSTWVTRRRENVDTTQISAVAATTYTVTDETFDFAEGHLIRASGFTETANNKLFVAGSGTTATSVIHTAGTVEASPPSTAKLQCVGFQGASGDIEATATGLSSTVLDFTTLGLAVGEWIKIGGSNTANQFATGANNDWVVITAIAANALTLTHLPSGWTVDTGTGKEIQVVVGEYIRNGVLKRSFTVRERFSDHSPVTYQWLTGMVLGQLALSAPSQAIITGTITFQGTDASMDDTGDIAGATTVAASTSDVMNSSSNVGRIAEGGSPITGKNYVLQADINLNNNLRYQNAVGSIGAVGVGAGEFGVTGTLQTYFDDKTIAQKVLNNTESSFDMRVADNSGQTYVFYFPRLKYSAGAPSVPGKNQDVTLSAEFQAILSTTYGYTMSIGRFSEIV